MAPPREAPVGFVVSATPLHQVAAWVAAIKGMDFSLLNPKSLKKPTPRLLFLAPVGPFVFGDLGKPKFELNSERGSSFWDLGGLKWTVVEELEGAVVA